MSIEQRLRQAGQDGWQDPDDFIRKERNIMLNRIKWSRRFESIIFFALIAAASAPIILLTLAWMGWIK